MAIYLGSNQVDLGLYNIQSDWAETDTTKESYIQNKPSIFPAVELTQSQYDALSTADKNNGNVYYVTDSTGTYLTASEVSYGSGSVQEALDDIWYDFGTDYTAPLATVISDNYTTLPDDSHPHFVKIVAKGGICVGYLYRYGSTYGGGVLARFDGRCFHIRIDDGTVIVYEDRIIVLTIPSFSSLPQTISDAAITDKHVCLKAELGTPSAQRGDWTVTTSTGSLTISGSISGSTTATLYLASQ